MWGEGGGAGGVTVFRGRELNRGVHYNLDPTI